MFSGSSDGDKAAWIAKIAAFADVGSVVWEITTLVTYGQHHLIGRAVSSWAGDFEGSWLSIYEYDSDGLLLRFGSFDESDEEGATELIESWFVESLPEPDSRFLFDKARRILEVAGARDWVSTADEFNIEEFRAVDHRSITTAEMDFAAWADRVEALYEMVPDLSQKVVGWLGLRPKAMFVEVHQPSASEEIYWRYLLVAKLDRGRISRLDYFDVDDFDAAQQCYRELISEGR